MMCKLYLKKVVPKNTLSTLPLSYRVAAMFIRGKCSYSSQFNNKNSIQIIGEGVRLFQHGHDMQMKYILKDGMVCSF